MNRASLAQKTRRLFPVRVDGFTQRIFGPHRNTFLAAAAADTAAAANSHTATRRAELTAELDDLKRRQANLINELERQQPSADPDVDAA
jgi:hypothetical protein